MEIRLLVFLLLEQIWNYCLKKSKDQFARLPHNRVGAIIKKPQWKLTSDVKKKGFGPVHYKNKEKHTEYTAFGFPLILY